jgi:signal transduction histidine kinase
MRSTTFRRYLRYAAVTMALWATVALLFASEGYLSGLYHGRPIDFGATLGYSLAFYGTWALVTPAVLFFAERWPFTADRVSVHLLRHGTAGIGIALLQAGLFAFLFWPIYGPTNEQETRLDFWAGMIAAHFPSNLLIYAVLAGGATALAAHVAARDREAQAARLQASLAEARLDALRAQIHPHFLFNTLHGISALVRDDPRAAERLIAKLGSLLRAALERQQVDAVPLAAEIDFLRNYLDIEGARFGDRLRSSVTMDDGVVDALVPPLLLQPLVENAIRHGLSATPETVTIEIRGCVDDDRLLLSVSDDGNGAEASALQDGIGLGNLRARLRQMFGREQSMRIETRPGQGFTVVLALPLRTAVSGS